MKKSFIMVEISCPECSDIIDLGEAEEGTYSCPYCEHEFYWESENSRFTPDSYWEDFDMMERNRNKAALLDKTPKKKKNSI